jgi:hypothetical protein
MVIRCLLLLSQKIHSHTQFLKTVLFVRDMRTRRRRDRGPTCYVRAVLVNIGLIQAKMFRCLYCQVVDLGTGLHLLA